MTNATVQETILLLAEALTCDGKIEETIELYKQVLTARDDSGEDTKDIYRAIAPLHAQAGNYKEAGDCYTKVLEKEE